MIQKEDQSPWGLIFILFGAGILSAFQVGKVPPVLSDIRLDLYISLFYAGWLLSIFNLTGLLFGTFAGAIADAIGHRRLMLAGLVLQIAGCFIGSFADSFHGLLASRVIEGAGFLAVIVSTPTLIFQVVKQKDMNVALSIWTCYLPAGASLMMILLPLILAGTNWRGLWQINAALMIGYTLILAKKTAHIKFMNPVIPFRFKKLIQDIVQTSTCAGPLLLAVIFITYALQWLAVMGFLPTLILEKYGFSKSLASILTAGMVFVNIFGNLAGGRLLKRGIKRWKLIAFACIIMGTSSIAIYWPGATFLLNYTGCLVFSIFGGLIPASILGGVPLYAPSKNLIATTNGLVIQGGQTGQVIGPPILAYLVSQTGSWSCGAWFLGSVALIGFVLSLCLSRLKPKVSS
ncbi:MAG: MFS transporter [Proteobacteria bacterium]|nr:MFS transporter [Pseudomonadota bacterium]